MDQETIDILMGCNCMCDVKILDSYLYETDYNTRMKIIFICTGCGKMVSASGNVDEIADVKMAERVRPEPIEDSIDD